MKKVSIANAEHYSWGTRCDGWHLVNQPELSVIRERMPPGAAEVNHLHRKARQFFYVVSGMALLDVEGVAVELHPGEGIEIPPGVAHQVNTGGAGEVEFLVISQPHSHGDRELVPQPR